MKRCDCGRPLVAGACPTCEALRKPHLRRARAGMVTRARVADVRRAEHLVVVLSAPCAEIRIDWRGEFHAGAVAAAKQGKVER